MDKVKRLSIRAVAPPHSTFLCLLQAYVRVAQHWSHQLCGAVLEVESAEGRICTGSCTRPPLVAYWFESDRPKVEPDKGDFGRNWTGRTTGKRSIIHSDGACRRGELDTSEH